MSFTSKFVWIALLLGAAWLVSACTVHPVMRPAQSAVMPADATDSAAATVANLREIVAAQLQVAPEAVAVVAVEAVEWPDACLGAPAPDEMCAQVVTPGYRITLAVDGQEYIYHTDQNGQLLRLVDGPAVDAGTSQGRLVWRGPAEPGSDDTAQCASLTIGSGEVSVFDCAGSGRTRALDGGLLATWTQIQDRFASFTLETPAARVEFTGTGSEAGAVWQRALLTWASTQYAELSTGQVSAAGNTVLAWDLGPADPAAPGCMHLTVLAWGEAYAETRSCTGGAVQSLAPGWLTTAEMAVLDGWLTGFAPMYAEPGYVAGAGSQPADAATIAAVTAWAAAVWSRLQDAATAQPASAVPTVCPAPTADGQLLVNTEDGYCLLYPAGYVAAATAPGNTSVVLGSAMNHVDPRVSIEVSDAAGRALAAIGDQLVADYASGFDVLRATTRVGGADALVLDNLPGQDLNRRVAVLHNGRLYSFFFTPLGETEAARAGMEAFYRGILASFTFLE